MIQDDAQLDEFDYYEELYSPSKGDRKSRRSAKHWARQRSPEAIREQLVADLGESTGQEGSFSTTYQPSRYETGWLFSSLRTFYDKGLISDVLARVKGGKEASVYCCQAHPATGMSLLAAKVYRPQEFRNLRNDKMYREGREILSGGGQVVKQNDRRLMLAIRKKTGMGLLVQRTSWLMHEYTTLAHLYQAGAAVPRPFAASENAVLMSYCGDTHRAAPTLHEISLSPEEAAPLFQEVLRNIELMLRLGLIHGDLSAYNILYWRGQIALIDFPQVTNSQENHNAHKILQRDLARVCEYFTRQGVSCDPAALMAGLWQRYGGVNRLDLMADASRDLQ